MGHSITSTWLSRVTCYFFFFFPVCANVTSQVLGRRVWCVFFFVLFVMCVLFCVFVLVWHHKHLVIMCVFCCAVCASVTSQRWVVMRDVLFLCVEMDGTPRHEHLVATWRFFSFKLIWRHKCLVIMCDVCSFLCACASVMSQALGRHVWCVFFVALFVLVRRHKDWLSHVTCSFSFYVMFVLMWRNTRSVITHGNPFFALCFCWWKAWWWGSEELCFSSLERIRCVFARVCELICTVAADGKARASCVRTRVCLARQ